MKPLTSRVLTICKRCAQNGRSAASSVSEKRERHTRKIPWLAIAPPGSSQLCHRRGYAEEAAEVVSAHGFTIRFYLTTDGNILSRGSSRINRPLCEDTTRRCVDGSVCYLRRTTGLRVRSPFPLGARPSPCSPFPLSPFPLPLWACPCPFPSELALSPFLPPEGRRLLSSSTEKLESYSYSNAHCTALWNRGGVVTWRR